jgi:type IV pilus assembly protein PilE
MRSPKPVVRSRWSAGFTLIELIIVIVIVSILMAVALPGFQDSMRKGRRADAKAGLMDAANRQERFMLDRSTYTIDMRDLGFSAVDMISEEGHYSVGVEAPDPNCPIATCYTVTATPVTGGAQADDSYCTSFTIKSTGAKTATGPAGYECW